MKAGGKYNWKNQPERLVYLGLCEPRNGRWHQFAKVDSPSVVWCEVLDEDLHRIEETTDAPPRVPDFHIADHGSVVILNPITPACIAWVEANVGNAETQHWGKHGVVVEPRYVDDIVAGMQSAGFQP